jgi:tetratricopeptide (TPR) repeat protein
LKIQKTLFLALLLSSSLFSVTDLHLEFSKIKDLIENRKLYEAENILDQTLTRGDLTPLEEEMIRYFRANIYLLEGRDSMAILLLNSLRKSQTLDSSSLAQIEKNLVELHFQRGEYSLALRVLNKNRGDDEAHKIRYLAYKGTGNIRKSYKYLKILVDRSTPSIQIWSDYLMFSQVLREKVSNINISHLLEKLAEKREFISFWRLFQQFDMIVESAETIKKGVEKGVIKSDNSYIDDTLNFYWTIKDFYSLEVILTNLFSEAYKTQLATLYIEIGEFESAKTVLQTLQSGQKHLILGKLFHINGEEEKAKLELSKALNFRESYGEAKEYLKNYF